MEMSNERFREWMESPWDRDTTYAFLETVAFIGIAGAGAIGIPYMMESFKSASAPEVQTVIEKKVETIKPSPVSNKIAPLEWSSQVAP